jgi:hypothetical protein
MIIFFFFYFLKIISYILYQFIKVKILEMIFKKNCHNKIFYDVSKWHVVALTNRSTYK